MKVLCKYTGIEIASAGGWLNHGILDIHPIFTAPLADLLELAAKEWQPHLPASDKLLLVAALGHSLGLFRWEQDFNLPLNPCIQTLETCYAPLLSLAKLCQLAPEMPSLPIIMIGQETYKLETFAPTLETIIDYLSYTEEQHLKTKRIAWLENHAQELAQRVRTGAKGKESALLKISADWAWLCCEDAIAADSSITPSLLKDWQTMLVTSPNHIKAEGFSLADLEELFDFMTINLPAGSLITREIIQHINSLMSSNMLYSIIDTTVTSVRAQKDESGATIAPVEPKREDFASLIDYARARAIYAASKLTTKSNIIGGI